MQRKPVIFRYSPPVFLVGLVFVMVLVVVVVGFWRAEPTESLGFAAAAGTRTPGPSPTPPFPPPTRPTLINPTPNRTLTAYPLTATPLPPTSTPLPTVPAVRRAGLWAENLIFGPPAPFGKVFKNRFLDISWSPDGTRLAFNLDEGQTIQSPDGKGWSPVTSIAIADKTGQSASRLATGFDPQWSPDANHIAYLAYIGTLDVLHVRIVNVQTKQVTEVAGLDKGGEFPTLAWVSPFELAFYDYEPRVFDLRSGQTRSLLSASILAQVEGSTPLKYLTAVPAKGVIGVASRTEILLLEWTNGTARLIRRIPEGLLDWWAISPDGQLLAYVPDGWDMVKIVGVRNEPPRIEISSYRPRSLTWSPDSTSLAFLDYDGGKIVSRDGSGFGPIVSIPKPQPLSPGPPPLLRVAWSPDGSQIAAANGNGGLFVIAVTGK